MASFTPVMYLFRLGINYLPDRFSAGAGGIQWNVTDPANMLKGMSELAYAGSGGGSNGNLDVQVNAGVAATAASGTLTWAAANVNGDTVTINGVVFTCATVPNPLNIYQFGIGSSAANQALLFWQQLYLAYTQDRTQPLYGRMVAPAPAAAIITITSQEVSVFGNAFTLAKSGANPAVSAGTLTGGTAPSVNRVYF